MHYAYAGKKQEQQRATNKASSTGEKPSLDALRTGATMPTPEQIGRRVDLPDAMRAKMEDAFGADLSAVKLYESQTVADAGANAVTQGANIAFATGMLDFSSYGGQALLGHEISHVLSQARGEVTGGGFLNDHALEARADREGAMAAAGQQIAMPTAAMSSITAAPAAGPMQADKDEKRQRQANEYRENEIRAYDDYIQTEDPQKKDALRAEFEKNRDLKVGRLKKLKMSPEEIEADNRGTTSPMAQLMRAHDRHISRVYTDSETDHVKAREIRQQQSTAYLGNLQKIMDSMTDEELKADSTFQKSLVDSYAAQHRRLYAPGSSAIEGDYTDHSQEISGPFLPGSGRDLLGSMYGRLMGAEGITNALTQSDDSASIHGLSQLAKDSGVVGLMDRQYEKAFRRKRHGIDGTDLETDRDAMREMLSKAVAPVAAQSPETANRAAELDQALSRPVPVAPPQEEPQRSFRETASEEEYNAHMAQMRQAEAWAAQRFNARRAMERPTGIGAAAKQLATSVQGKLEDASDAISSVKGSVRDWSYERERKKEDTERKRQFDRDLEKRSKPATKEELRLFRSEFGPNTSPTTEQLARLRNEIELAKSMKRRVNVRGAVGDL